MSSVDSRCAAHCTAPHGGCLSCLSALSQPGRLVFRAGCRSRVGPTGTVFPLRQLGATALLSARHRCSIVGALLPAARERLLTLSRLPHSSRLPMSELVSASSMSCGSRQPRLKSISGRLRRGAWLPRVCIDGHRKAQAAERLHLHLSSVSESALARGMKRNETSQCLRERLYR